MIADLGPVVQSRMNKDLRNDPIKEDELEEAQDLWSSQVAKRPPITEKLGIKLTY